MRAGGVDENAAGRMASPHLSADRPENDRNFNGLQFISKSVGRERSEKKILCHAPERTVCRHSDVALAQLDNANCKRE